MICASPRRGILTNFEKNVCHVGKECWGSLNELENRDVDKGCYLSE